MGFYVVSFIIIIKLYVFFILNLRFWSSSQTLLSKYSGQEKKSMSGEVLSKIVYVISEGKKTTKVSNHSTRLYQINQSHFVYRHVGRDVVNHTTNHCHHDGPANHAPCALKVGAFVSTHCAPRLRKSLDFLFRMIYFEGKPSDSAHTGCSVSANKHTQRWWLAAGSKNVNGKEKSL